MKKSISIDSVDRIKNYVLKLLSLKGRSEKEILQRLRQKDFPEELIHKTIQCFKDNGLINDRSLAKTIVAYCEESRMFGAFGCKQYLKKRGIPEEIVKNIPFSYEKEVDKANRLVSKKQNRLKEYPAGVKLSKLYGLLKRKGFDSEVISEVLKERKSQ